MTLHWLWITEFIPFKLAVNVHRVLNGNAPSYLGHDHSFGCVMYQVNRPCHENGVIAQSQRPAGTLFDRRARAFPVSGPTICTVHRRTTLLTTVNLSFTAA
jgi:hypothetical protein